VCKNRASDKIEKTISNVDYLSRLDRLITTENIGRESIWWKKNATFEKFVACWWRF
jgi:hypothetical protein